MHDHQGKPVRIYICGKYTTLKLKRKRKVREATGGARKHGTD